LSTGRTDFQPFWNHIVEDTGRFLPLFISMVGFVCGALVWDYYTSELKYLLSQKSRIKNETRETCHQKSIEAAEFTFFCETMILIFTLQ